MIVAAALMLAQAASGTGENLQPATAAAIVAGARACLGATVDPAGQDVRLSGWADATAAQTSGMHTDGHVVTRDNVVVVVKTGIEGGCVVQARTMPGFDNASFLKDLGGVVGTAVGTDPKNPVTNLPNGELLVTQVGGGFAMLVVANPHGQRASHSQGK